MPASVRQRSGGLGSAGVARPQFTAQGRTLARGATTLKEKRMATVRIEPRDATARVNGLKLHYLDWGGEGLPPFVALHGFSAQAHYWDSLAAALHADYHVYALDQRGHGDSDWADDYGPETMPADLTDFVDALKIDRFVLIGHSMGGGVAFRFAVEQPQRLERLIIVDSGLPSPDRPPLPDRDNSVTRSLQQESFDDEDAVVAFLQSQSPNVPIERIRAVLGQWFRRQPDGRYTRKFDPKLRNRLAGSADALEQFRRQARELRGKVGAISCPTLLVRGGASDILSQEAAEETVAALPNATLVVVPGAGHNVPSDNPRAFRAIVRDWLGLGAL
jgi:esterase